MQRKRFFSTPGLAGFGSTIMLAAQAGSYHVQGSFTVFPGEGVVGKSISWVTGFHWQKYQYPLSVNAAISCDGYRD
jgi:hypothetical protein